MISTLALRASSTTQCGCGWVSGTPGARTSAAICDQSVLRKSVMVMPASPAFADACRGIVAGNDFGAPGQQGARADQAGTAQAEHGDLFAGKGRDRNHDAATSASGWTVLPGRARPRRSRTGSRSAARSSRVVRSDDGSAPS